MIPFSPEPVVGPLEVVPEGAVVVAAVVVGMVVGAVVLVVCVVVLVWGSWRRQPVKEVAINSKTNARMVNFFIGGTSFSWFHG